MSSSRIWIETKDGSIFEGTVAKHTSDYVELYNIICRNQNSDCTTEYDDNLTFYRGEIDQIYQIKESPSKQQQQQNGPSTLQQNGLSTPQQNGLSTLQENGIDNIETVKIEAGEINRLKRMAMSFIFIDVESKYKEAVKVLKQAESVGVVGLGSTFDRTKSLSLLVVCNFEQVFIFDMRLLRNIKELGDILEASFVTKVVYDGAALFDCLYHRHKIEMVNVFDIKIYDSILSKKTDGGVAQEEPKDLGECLGKHFNFPYALMESAMDDVKVDKIWFERPVTKSLKAKASQLVTYLLPLRDHLLRIILKEYNNAIVKNYEKYKNMSDIELLMTQKLALRN